MLMVMSTKESGRMIRLMDLESTITLMVLSMKDTGKKTNSMAMAKKHGLIELAMRESTMMDKKMGLANSIGLMAPVIKGNFPITTFRVTVSIAGLMEDSSMGNG